VFSGACLHGMLGDEQLRFPDFGGPQVSEHAPPDETLTKRTYSLVLRKTSWGQVCCTVGDVTRVPLQSGSYSGMFLCAGWLERPVRCGQPQQAPNGFSPVTQALKAELMDVSEWLASDTCFEGLS